MNPLIELQKLGQSIWYDNIRRSLLDDGSIARLIEEDDLRGVTSNPTIFDKAISDSGDYNDELRRLALAGRSVQEIYETLAVADIQRACDMFRPVYDKTDGLDGYVSLEVSPLLAGDTEGTIAEAKRLWQTVDRRNVMIKVPATPEGIPAIRALIAAGLNINVTLIFSRDAYLQVMAAYINGLEDRASEGKPVDHIASVASFFVSRVDSLVDKQLDALMSGTNDGVAKTRYAALRGRAAIANAKLAYQDFKQVFATERFQALAAKGARVQRPLWASTGTKNPKYSDVLYVDTLIGPDTVNTVPPATLDAYRDHGQPGLTLETELDSAGSIFNDLAASGIDMRQVTQKLLDDGVKSFADSFNQLLGSIEVKRALLLSGIAERQTAALGDYAETVKGTIARADQEKWVRRLFEKDAALWKSDEKHQQIIGNSLGWLRVPQLLVEHAAELKDFAAEVSESGFDHVVLMGMGGSSLCPEVFRRTFGRQQGFPELHVLDSTDPATVDEIERRVDLARTLFVVASKSGTTTEPLMFYTWFFDRLRGIKKDKAGENFVAITDPDTKMDDMAKSDGFRRIFRNPADIGGRYSALSFFGMVPAALQGFDFTTLLERAERATVACGPLAPAENNVALKLGAALGALAGEGRDKLTLAIDKQIASLGLWIEQLIAESTGKEGKGIVPVAGEPLGPPGSYGNDRVFVHIGIGQTDSDTDQKLRALEAAGNPVIRRLLNDPLDLGEEFYVWEVATAMAGVVLGIDPFDQPNVQESKDNTRDLLAEYRTTGALPGQALAAQSRYLKVYADEETIHHLGHGLEPDTFIAAHLDRASSGDYVALLAYLHETEEHEQILQQIRTHLRETMQVATTTGYGPRFLHSTGQLHKGGADNGVFVQITVDDVNDMQLPGQSFTWSVLKQAQALGDFQSLASRGRRAIRVHLGTDVAAGLRVLLEIVQQSFPIGRGRGLGM